MWPQGVSNAGVKIELVETNIEGKEKSGLVVDVDVG